MRRATLLGVSMAVLAGAIIGSVASSEKGSARNPGDPAPGAATKSTLRQQVEARRPVFERAELKRQEILGRLEFIPRPPMPGFRPRFPRLCLLPAQTLPNAIDPHRSLFVHDRATLDASGGGFTADFSLKRTLDQIAAQVSMVVPGTTAAGIFTQFWDTQSAAPGVTAGPHCSDNGTTVNDFPITCPRNEGLEAVGTPAEIDARIQEYKVLALVNRLDLAHEGWRNCGEHRIIYGKRANIKNLIIFEAVLPNPRPGCREGCVPVAEFWKSLSAIDDPIERAKRLDEFFYKGLPGFRPVVHVNHYSSNGVSSGYGSSGSGQVRTNQFLQTSTFQPWLLKEFKTVIDCGTSPCKFFIVPTMVKVNPHGELWNEDNLDPRAVDFRADTLLQAGSLASTTLTGIGYGVDLKNDAGQSMSLTGPGFVDNYRTQMLSAGSTAFQTALATGSLTAEQMANRALTQSCAGCHMPPTFGLNAANSIGSVMTPNGSPVSTIDHWPDVVTAGFVHVDTMPATVRPELAANPAAFGSGMGQEISKALLDFFLPARKDFLLTQLNALRCTCIPRFTFLAVEKRRMALEAEALIQKQFEDRFEALEKRIAESRTRPAGEGASNLDREKAVLVSERDKALITMLGRKGITLPDAELLDLKPQAVKLNAARDAKGDAARERALRVAEVNRMLRGEPARRTVTGSFATH